MLVTRYEWPYHIASVISRPLCEGERQRARSILWWGIAWEMLLLLLFAHAPMGFICSHCVLLIVRHPGCSAATIVDLTVRLVLGCETAALVSYSGVSCWFGPHDRHVYQSVYWKQPNLETVWVLLILRSIYLLCVSSYRRPVQNIPVYKCVTVASFREAGRMLVSKSVHENDEGLSHDSWGDPRRENDILLAWGFDLGGFVLAPRIAYSPGASRARSGVGPRHAGAEVSPAGICKISEKNDTPNIRYVCRWCVESK